MALPNHNSSFFHFNKSQMSEKWGWYFPSSFPSSFTPFHIVSAKIIALRVKQGKGKQIPPKPQLWTKMDHKHISPSVSLPFPLGQDYHHRRITNCICSVKRRRNPSVKCPPMVSTLQRIRLDSRLSWIHKAGDMGSSLIHFLNKF